MKIRKKFKFQFLFSLFLVLSLLSGCSETTGQELANQVSQSLEYLEEAEEILLYEEESSVPSPGAVSDSEGNIDRSSSNDSVPMEETEPEQDTDDTLPDPNGSYTSKEEVALYLHTYGKLPSNFITKNEAKSLGWVSKEGNLDEVAPGKSIGGDRFWNNEELLPETNEREYYECDINFDGSFRGAERIVYSNDGLIYYTCDHYETFELLYGFPEEGE